MSDEPVSVPQEEPEDTGKAAENPAPAEQDEAASSEAGPLGTTSPAGKIQVGSRRIEEYASWVVDLGTGLLQ